MMLVHGISSSYLFELSDECFEMSYGMDISIAYICIRNVLRTSSFHSATGPRRLGSLAFPSDPGCHGLLCGTLHHCDAPLLSRRHRQAQTRFAPPKLPQHCFLPPLPLENSLRQATPFGLTKQLCPHHEGAAPPPPPPTRMPSGGGSGLLRHHDKRFRRTITGRCLASGGEPEGRYDTVKEWCVRYLSLPPPSITFFSPLPQSLSTPPPPSTLKNIRPANQYSGLCSAVPSPGIPAQRRGRWSYTSVVCS